MKVNQCPNQQKIDQEVEASIVEVLSKTPLLLEENDQVDKVASILLPYYTGIEFEIERGDNFDIEIFRHIPNILEIKIDNDEQRYKLTNGIEGLKALYRLCDNLKEYCNPDYKSNIHYHIDFTDTFQFVNHESIKLSSEFILTELDKWNTINVAKEKREVKLDCKGNWVNFRNFFKTMEVRIGEQTFEYELIIKRILHLQEIAKQVKIMMEGQYYKYLPKKKHEKPKVDNIEEIINNRVIEI